MSRKLSFTLLLLLLGFALLSAAETSPGWTYGAELGIVRGDNAASKEGIGPMGRGFLQLKMIDILQMRIGAGFTHFGASGDDEYTANLFKGDTRLILSPWHDKKYAPFFWGGAGAAIRIGDGRNDVIPLIPVGVGLEIKLKPGMAMEVGLGYNYSNRDEISESSLEGNAFANGKNKDGFFQLTAGLSFSDPGPVQEKPRPTPPPVLEVEKPKPPVVEKVEPDLRNMDSDRDGLSDWDEINIHKTDPYKADTDGDGLSDYDEVMRYKTNPLNVDTDGDGLNDYDEVMKHKTDPLNPDTDGDGLNDYDEVMKYKTDPLNPDTDGDGLSDYDEVMVYKTDPLNPDTDGGSVNDGVEVARGTDPLDPKDDVIDLTEGAKFELEGIVFDTAKYTFKPESMPILEKALNVLTKNPEVRVLIVGHTDSVGSVASNMTLSRQRAEAVMNWLTEHGISASRLRAEGRGPHEPKDTNDTDAGRQRNRRIEFEIQ